MKEQKKEYKILKILFEKSPYSKKSFYMLDFHTDIEDKSVSHDLGQELTKWYNSKPKPVFSVISKEVISRMLKKSWDCVVCSDYTFDYSWAGEIPKETERTIFFFVFRKTEK